MKNVFVYLFSTVVFLVTSSISQAALVSDNFESGNLDNWLIEGRQLGTHTANVITCDTGSLCGHLYQSGSFTEININQYLGYDPNETFSFDMKVDVSSTTPPAPNFYGISGVGFSFLDQNDDVLGSVWYLASTTNYPTTNWVSPTTSVNIISENTWHHFDLDIAILLSQINIDESLIATTQMKFNVYSSTWPSPTVTAELWVDNVNSSPVPVPAALWLLGSGLISLIGMARRTTHNHSL